jgi:hypothetical protein
MIIEEIMFLNGACSRKGNGLLFFVPSDLRSTKKNLRYALCLPAEADLRVGWRYLSSVVPQGGTQEDALCFSYRGGHGTRSRTRF